MLIGVRMAQNGVMGVRVQFTENYADYPHYADYEDNADNLKHPFCVNNTETWQSTRIIINEFIYIPLHTL